MKNALPVIIVVIVLAVLIWFIFKKVLPNMADAKKQKLAAQKEASLTNAEADAEIKFINQLPKF